MTLATLIKRISGVSARSRRGCICALSGLASPEPQADFLRAHLENFIRKYMQDV